MYLGSLGEWYENVDDGKIIEGAGGYFEGYMQRLFRGWEGSGAEVGEVWSGGEFIFFLHLLCFFFFSFWLLHRSA